MPAGAEVTYSVRCGRIGNDTVIVSSAPRRATAPLLVSGVRRLNERDQSLNPEHTFRCGSAPMGKIEVSINPNVVKTTSNSGAVSASVWTFARTVHATNNRIGPRPCGPPPRRENSRLDAVTALTCTSAGLF